MPRKKTEKEYVSAVGRRKEAVARIRLFKGKGESIVNGKPINEYFSGVMAKVIYSKPFNEVEMAGKYFVTAKIVGGGQSSQLDAFVHGTSRALALTDPEKFRPALKKRGLLTRDARVREPRKVGTGGKARRKKQSPKR